MGDDDKGDDEGRIGVEIMIMVEGCTYTLVFPSYRGFFEEFLDRIHVQYFVDLFQGFVSLLQSMENRDFDQREFYRRNLWMRKWMITTGMSDNSEENHRDRNGGRVREMRVGVRARMSMIMSMSMSMR